MSDTSRKDTFRSLITLLFLVCLGILLGSGAIYLYSHYTGQDINLLTEDLQNVQNHQVRYLFRAFAAINHIAIFILPALVFYRLHPGDRNFALIHEDKTLKYKLLTLGICVIVLSMPVVQFFHMLNQQIPFPDFLREIEMRTDETIKGLLRMSDPVEFVSNILVIALLPAIGEEMIFRGGLQRQLHRILGPHAAIWLAAVVFSAIHMQFEGFIPRVFLGAMLGYFYYWSGNLLIPICMHFANNAVQVLGVYFMQDQLADMNISDQIDFPWPFILMSAMLTFFLLQQTIKMLRPANSPPAP